MRKSTAISIVLVAFVYFAVLATAQQTTPPDLICDNGASIEPLETPGQVGVWCYTSVPTEPPEPTATMTATFLPTVINSPTPTNTPIPPTETNTPEPTATNTPEPTSTSSAIAETGVIGDSASEPYTIAGRGTQPPNYVWGEVAYLERGAQLRIVAVSGQSTAHLEAQVDNLESYITSGQVNKVIIWMGANDIKSKCDNPNSGTSYYSMIGRFERTVNDLILLGIAPANIHMVTLTSPAQGGGACTYATEVGDFVDNVNAWMWTLEGSYGIDVIDSQAVFDLMVTYVINGGGDIMINGVVFENRVCTDPVCMSVDNGHPNTVLSALIFNALFADVLGFAPLSDSEIVEVTGIND
jgi:hypothetical protein